jgi:hypothetical protein
VKAEFMVLWMSNPIALMPVLSAGVRPQDCCGTSVSSLYRFLAGFSY